MNRKGARRLPRLLVEEGQRLLRICQIVLMVRDRRLILGELFAQFHRFLKGGFRLLWRGPLLQQQTAEILAGHSKSTAIFLDLGVGTDQMLENIPAVSLLLPSPPV
jgi:hypothetical protein